MANGFLGLHGPLDPATQRSLLQQQQAGGLLSQAGIMSPAQQQALLLQQARQQNLERASMSRRPLVTALAGRAGQGIGRILQRLLPEAEDSESAILNKHLKGLDPDDPLALTSAYKKAAVDMLNTGHLDRGSRLLELASNMEIEQQQVRAETGLTQEQRADLQARRPYDLAKTFKQINNIDSLIEYRKKMAELREQFQNELLEGAYSKARAQVLNSAMKIVTNLEETGEPPSQTDRILLGLAGVALNAENELLWGIVGNFMQQAEPQGTTVEDILREPQ